MICRRNPRTVRPAPDDLSPRSQRTECANIDLVLKFRGTRACPSYPRDSNHGRAARSLRRPDSVASHRVE
jgi:hypothetical protein